MAKRLEYLDLTEKEFWRLRRFDNSLPAEPKSKRKKPTRWRKAATNGWLVGQYVKLERGAPWTIEWYMADMSGQFAKIMNKAW